MKAKVQPEPSVAVDRMSFDSRGQCEENHKHMADVHK